MKKCYVSSALFLTVKDSQICAVFDWNQCKIQVIQNKSWLTILEIFVHEQTLEGAYQRFLKINSSPISENLLLQCSEVITKLDTLVVLLANKTLKVLTQGVASLQNPQQQIDLCALSQENYQVILSLFSRDNFTAEDELDSFEKFNQLIKHLASLGLLSPSVNTLDWGDLKRNIPLCNLFGFTRGTPIDRYYLSQFISEIRADVIGNVLEVGGVIANREMYGFDNANEYHSLDIVARPGVTLVGDIHSPELLEPETLDSVVIFNVLEHCHNPWIVVQNIYNALKLGGHCFCMVPSAQRLHNMPGDYWRPLPDGMKQLFKEFREQKLFVYGNPQTVIASFMGISTEELSSKELDDYHPDYPVATCLIAVK
jgi:SAM-dependent methyltransferase